jgi:hypothetical protein
VLNGGLLLLGLAMSAGWTAGRLIERRGQR